jgi:hypothetical protein
MPKALSSLQSVQRSYTSEFSVVSLGWVGWLVTKERKEGNLEFASYQGCSGYDGCGIVVIYSVSELVSEGVGIQGKRKGPCSSAATRIVLATDARGAVAVDTVTAE